MTGVAVILIVLMMQPIGSEKPDTITIAATEVAVEIPPTIEQPTTADPLPPFHEIDNNTARREAFIEYLAPIVAAVNDEMRQRRAALLAVAETADDPSGIDEDARAWLERMRVRYRVQEDHFDDRLEELLARVDIVPVSLAVAQGAIESGWGTSRFARQGNNLFGKWCFTEGCGIVPARRPPTATYEVESYDDVAEAVRVYMHHLNSHPNYWPLRDARAEARAQDQPPQGSDLAIGLEFYSAKGMEYVDSVRATIRSNELEAGGSN